MAYDSGESASCTTVSDRICTYFWEYISIFGVLKCLNPFESDKQLQQSKEKIHLKTPP